MTMDFLAELTRLEQANGVILIGRDLSKILNPCPTCNGDGYKIVGEKRNEMQLNICPTCRGIGSEA